MVECGNPCSSWHETDYPNSLDTSVMAAMATLSRHHIASESGSDSWTQRFISHIDRHFLQLLIRAIKSVLILHHSNHQAQPRSPFNQPASADASDG